MKILLTVHQFFPQSASGTEVLARSVACELIARGHEVRILTGYQAVQAMEDQDRLDEYDFAGIHVYRFHHAYTPMAGQTSMIELSYDNHLAATFFDRILEHYKPDLVHFFHLNRLGTGLIESAVRAGIPGYMTPTDFWAICATGQLILPDGRQCQGPSVQAGNCVKHFARNRKEGVVGLAAAWLPTKLADGLARLTQTGWLPAYPYHQEVKAINSRLETNIARLNQLNRIVVPNNFMRIQLIRHGVLPRRIVQAAFGVDVVESGEQSPRAAARQPLRIGYIGTLGRHKGCHVLIEAFKRLPVGQAVLWIYGNISDFPEYSNELLRLAGPQSGIEFKGVFDNSEITEVMSALDVLVVPSLWVENTPLVLYSAQAARCPVVASDFPGIAEVIQDEANGLLFEPGDAQALARQLARLADDSALVNRLSSNAKPPKSTAAYVNKLLEIWEAAE